MGERWTEQRAWDWYHHQPWIVGCNFIPSTAINQLEMWQAETFDPQGIERELKLAESIGFNTVRVYLHDLLWSQDEVGFKGRIDTFLKIATASKIKPIFVFFDDCWSQDFTLGKQPEPRPGVHNSGWVQSPGTRIVLDPACHPYLKPYVQDILVSFGKDDRVRMWDLYNEPGNNQLEEKSIDLLKAVFEWAREVDPCQPLSVGVWFDLPILNQFQLANSDVITFHDYLPEDHLRSQIAELRAYGRPLICTEYLARGRNCCFETNMPVFKQEHVGCINWGLVNGKTQTNFAWASVQPSDIWFHDIFNSDGRPYREEEVKFIKSITQDNRI
jgi:hypothetical protein